MIEYRIGSHVGRHGRQHLLFPVNQVGGIKRGDFKTVTMRDRVRGASFHAVSTKNAAVVIDVINLGVSLRAAYPILSRVFRRLDVYAIRRTIRRAQKARYTLL